MQILRPSNERTYFSVEARDVWTAINLAPLAATEGRIE